MAFKSLSELDDYQLTNSDQDCRGWDVVNASGTQIGTVREMLVDTEVERVAALELDSGAQILVNEISLRDGRVVAANSDIAGAGGTTTTPPVGAVAAPQSVVDGELVVPVVEEQIRIGKRDVDRVGARVSTRVEETPVQESVTLRDEQVHVERRPVNRPVRDDETAGFKEGTVEVHARSEEAVVDKRARVVGEVVISKSATEREETVRDTLQRTDVEVDQLSADRDLTKRRT
jgi:uncharacterized protein (TIGR02271 family)